MIEHNYQKKEVVPARQVNVIYEKNRLKMIYSMSFEKTISSLCTKCLKKLRS